MLFIKLIRHLQGYVVFAITGRFPERFLNLAAKAGIGLWDIHRTESGMSAAIYTRQYRRLRPLARKSSSRLRVRGRKGLPFLVHKYARRPGLFIGVLLFVGVLYASTLFVWNVNVTGCKTLDPAEVRETLREIGISVGTMQKDVDTGHAAEKMMLKLPELSWISINNHGTTIFVELSEMTAAPEMINTDAPCNIKAKREGQIKSMQVYQGAPVVKVGDAVAAGDMLISGVVQNADMSTSIYRAQADIVAITKHVFTAEIPLNETLRTPTGNTAVIRRLRLFSTEFPLTLTTSPQGNWDYEPVAQQWKLFGFELPAATLEEQWYEYTEETRAISREEAIERAKGEILKASQREMRDITVTDRTEKITDGNNSITVEVTYTCEENIGVQIGFEVSKSEDN